MAIKVGKGYESVADLLRGEYPDNPEYIDSFLKTYAKEQVSQYLFMLRTSCGVTQEELAKRMGVSQSKIAKLEDRGDNVKFNDVIAFARALGHDTSLQFTEERANLAGMLRWHFAAITAIMTKLERMAQGDPEISSGVFKHFSEEAGKMFHEVLPLCFALLEKTQLQHPDQCDNGAKGLYVDIITKDVGALVG